MPQPQQFYGPERGCARISGSARVLLDSDIGFVPGSPFYELLTTFVVACAGLTPVFDAVHYEGFLEGVAGVFPGFVWRQMTTDLGKRIAEVRGGAIAQAIAENALCCMLANLAWQRTPFDSKHSLWTRPEVQYFRHVRNAASHGNQWFFSDAPGRETPDLPASWRGSTIDHNKKGSANPLHGTACFGTALGSADLWRLLLDIEPLV